MKNVLGHELGALLRLAGPLVSAQLAHALMIFTDTLMMAMLGPQQLAGGALGVAVLPTGLAAVRCVSRTAGRRTCN